MGEYTFLQVKPKNGANNRALQKEKEALISSKGLECHYSSHWHQQGMSACLDRFHNCFVLAAGIIQAS